MWKCADVDDDDDDDADDDDSRTKRSSHLLMFLSNIQRLIFPFSPVSSSSCAPLASTVNTDTHTYVT